MIDTHCLAALEDNLARGGAVAVAVGECGLDGEAVARGAPLDRQVRVPDRLLLETEDGVPGARAPVPGRREPRLHGSIAFVTAAFGLAAAGAVVHGLTGVRPDTPRLLDEAEQRRRRQREE